MEYGFTTAAYIVAAVLFILSLGGLSGQESAKRAVWYGIVGMTLAVLATLVGPGSGLWPVSLALIAAGGLIGTFIAKRVQMTEMPQLVAAMHSLVGLAAVFVGFTAESCSFSASAACSALASFISNWKQLPLSNWLVTVIDPPISSINCLEIDKPNPVPPKRRVGEVSSCEKGRNN